MTYDIAIIGAGCAGLSLAYQIAKIKNHNKKIIILDNKKEFKKDRTWSFWKVEPHDFEDCIEKQWSKFDIKLNDKIKLFDQTQYSYQTIDSLKFYHKVRDQLTKGFTIKLDTTIDTIETLPDYFQLKTSKENIDAKIIFDSRVPPLKTQQLYQHFYGIEIKTTEDVFDEEKVTLMDFDCNQKDGVHFFYILPFKKNKALIETTWLSNLNDLNKEQYVDELNDYIKNNYNLKNFNIIREEMGAIPMFRTQYQNSKNYFNIGLRGNVNRMSTGYAFPYIQNQSRMIAHSLENLTVKSPISSKYEFLDRLFVKVLQKNIAQMPSIFFKLFDTRSQDHVIRFLSSSGTLYDDFKIISKMPKFIFLKSLFS